MDRCLFILLVSLIDVGLISPKLFLLYFDFIYSFTFDGTCIVGYFVEWKVKEKIIII